MDAAGALAEVLKGEGPRVLATLARTIGDLAVAEDALSEATITALDAWPGTGIPGNPRAWLAVVARRKALDLLRRESARAAKEAAAFRWGTGVLDGAQDCDDRGFLRHWGCRWAGGGWPACGVFVGGGTVPMRSRGWVRGG